MDELKQRNGMNTQCLQDMRVLFLAVSLRGKMVEEGGARWRFGGKTEMRLSIASATLLLVQHS